MKKIKTILFGVVMLATCIFTSCNTDNDPLMESTVTSIYDEENVTELRAATIPKGWKDIPSSDQNGLRYYIKGTKNGTWYIIKVYLPKVKVSPIYEIASQKEKTPIFYKRSLGEWNNHKLGKGALALINASFFLFKGINFLDSEYGPFGNKAKVAHLFGFHNYSYVFYGYETYEENQRTLWIQDQRASVKAPINSISAAFRPFELVLNGLHPVHADKERNKQVGRTMVGVPSKDPNLLYFFIAGTDATATQAEAVKSLEEFGCTSESIVMLDGSGSSQLIWNGSYEISSSDSEYMALPNRKVPVVLRFDRRR